MFHLNRWVKSSILPLVKEKTLFCLSGEVGAGKTELVKNICQELGYDQVQSPTFSLAHSYSKPESNLLIYHVDLYRIQSEEDLESTGFWDLFSEKQAVLFVEWSDLVTKQSWPWDWVCITIHIEKDENQKRKIMLRYQQP